MIAVDICNSLANIAGELSKLGISQDVYPSPLPENYFSLPEGLQIFQKAKPINGAKFMVSHFSTLYSGVTYVTTRPIEAEMITYRWLSDYGFPVGKILFCKWQEKVAIYDKLNPMVIIEDDPRVIPKLSTLVFVPQWKYNSHIKGKNIIPFYEWGRASGWQ